MMRNVRNLVTSSSSVSDACKQSVLYHLRHSVGPQYNGRAGSGGGGDGSLLFAWVNAPSFSLQTEQRGVNSELLRPCRWKPISGRRRWHAWHQGTMAVSRKRSCSLICDTERATHFVGSAGGWVAGRGSACAQAITPAAPPHRLAPQFRAPPVRSAPAAESGSPRAPS